MESVIDLSQSEISGRQESSGRVEQNKWNVPGSPESSSKLSDCSLYDLSKESFKEASPRSERSSEGIPKPKRESSKRSGKKSELLPSPKRTCCNEAQLSPITISDRSSSPSEERIALSPYSPSRRQPYTINRLRREKTVDSSILSKFHNSESLFPDEITKDYNQNSLGRSNSDMSILELLMKPKSLGSQESWIMDLHKCAHKFSHSSADLFTTSGELTDELSSPNKSPPSNRVQRDKITQFPQFRSKKFLITQIKKSTPESLSKEWSMAVKSKLSLEEAEIENSSQHKYSPQLLRNVNKKLTKEEALKRVTVIVPPKIADHPDPAKFPLLKHFEESSIRIETEKISEHHDLIAWKVSILREWNSSMNIWTPCKERETCEKFVISILTVEDVRNIMLNYQDKFVEYTKSIIDSIPKNFCPPRIIYIVEGLKRYRDNFYNRFSSEKKNCGRKSGNTHNLEEGIIDISDIEDAFLELQFCSEIRAFVVHSSCPAETGEFLLAFTNQISKYEESKRDLELYKDVDMKAKSLTGTNMTDTWAKMLEKIPGITNIRANAILKKYPTIKSIVKEYGNCSREEEKLRACAKIQFNIGTENNCRLRNIGPQLSKKIYLSICSKDRTLTLND